MTRSKRPRSIDMPVAWVMQRMRLPLVVASIACSLFYAGMADAMPVKKITSSRKLGLNIRVEGNGWGQVSRESIETVLYSVADELMSRLPKKLSTPIVVTHTDSNPIALYDRGPQGEYLVHLHAKGENWHLYVYEFAHELCHILSNYEENVGVDTSRYNQWFEETLCETASLFTLKNLALTWKISPPTPEMGKEADKLGRFFDLLINEAHRRLPPHTPLAVWLRENEGRLRDDPYLRDKNEVVANLLLPLFDGNPENWDALSYLNLDPGDARDNLQEYLGNWYRNAPAEHKTFIASVLTMLRLGDVAPPSPAGPADKALVASTSDSAGQKTTSQSASAEAEPPAPAGKGGSADQGRSL